MLQADGMSVEERASLHESCVKGAQELQGAFPRRSPRPRISRPSQRSLELLRVDPRVMAEARKLLARRPGSKLQIVDSTTVRLT